MSKTISGSIFFMTRAAGTDKSPFFGRSLLFCWGTLRPLCFFCLGVLRPLVSADVPRLELFLLGFSLEYIGCACRHDFGTRNVGEGNSLQRVERRNAGTIVCVMSTGYARGWRLTQRWRLKTEPRHGWGFDTSGKNTFLVEKGAIQTIPIVG